MLNMLIQEPTVRGEVGSCLLDQQSTSAGVRPSLPFPSVQTPKGSVCTLGITWPGNRTPDSLLIREAEAALLPIPEQSIPRWGRAGYGWAGHGWGHGQWALEGADGSR